MSKDEKKTVQTPAAGIVELGRVEELTGRDSVGQLTDGGTLTGVTRKDKGGSAGE
ncbi:hypothetical protein [Tateyamaria pelophila]|uniref:hypothetical protein n=1 Tax=Tateyamaria pelophila TaxID=328415 RepID=UPI001CBDD95A|nr:hypothetical protein [Tateyamaria pelophila]